MPELPEVETVARGLNERVSGDVIESIWLSSYKEPMKSPPEEIARTLAGSRIDGARRVGKHIVIDLTRDGPGTTSGVSSADRAQWIVHLGMTGRMLVNQPDIEVPKHTHAIARLRSGREIRFVDPRRFGRLEVKCASFTGPGTEPTTISRDDFAALFRGRKTPIKAALLNQKLLHGVGNIYADESLFRAGVRPKRRAASLTREELKRLHTGLKKVLAEAIKLGGSSVSDYVDAEGRTGFFQLKHRVYMRTGEPCYACGTPIKRIVIGGRSTHYCPKCQK